MEVSEPKAKIMMIYPGDSSYADSTTVFYVFLSNGESYTCSMVPIGLVIQPLKSLSYTLACSRTQEPNELPMDFFHSAVHLRVPEDD